MTALEGRFVMTLSAEQRVAYRQVQLEVERRYGASYEEWEMQFHGELIRHLPPGLHSLVWLLIGHLSGQLPEDVGLCCVDRPPVL